MKLVKLINLINPKQNELNLNLKLNQKDNYIECSNVKYSSDHLIINDGGIDIQDNYIMSFKNISNNFNSLILTYGQSGAGKTQTISNIINRLSNDLFIENENEDENQNQKMFAYEIHNNKQIDILGTINSQEQINSLIQFKNAIKKINDQRKIATTCLNKSSSRSHLFIEIQKESSSKNIVFIDLAGSERVIKTLATGFTLKEANSINQSLLYFNLLVNDIAKGITPNFNHCSLTKAMKKYLSGEFSITFLCCLSLDISNHNETINSLKMTCKSRSINRNSLKLNQSSSNINNSISYYKQIQDYEQSFVYQEDNFPESTLTNIFDINDQQQNHEHKEQKSNNSKKEILLLLDTLQTEIKRIENKNYKLKKENDWYKFKYKIFRDFD